MRRCLCVLACAVSLCAASDDGKAAKEVLAAMDAYKEAMIHNDVPTLDKLLGDDLAYTHSHGEFQDKASVLKSAAPPPNIVRMEFSGTTVKVYGDTAPQNGSCIGTLVPLHVLHTWIPSTCCARSTPRRIPPPT